MVDPSGSRSGYGAIFLFTPVAVIQHALHTKFDPELEPVYLPAHPQDLVKMMSEDLDTLQRTHLSHLLHCYSDLLQLPGSILTRHTVANPALN